MKRCRRRRRRRSRGEKEEAGLCMTEDGVGKSDEGC